MLAPSKEACKWLEKKGFIRATTNTAYDQYVCTHAMSASVSQYASIR